MNPLDFLKLVISFTQQHEREIGTVAQLISTALNSKSPGETLKVAMAAAAKEAIRQ